MNTELQKMLAGELYDASDAALLQMRITGRQIFTKYNLSRYIF
ncbi:hypothetical protein FDK13_29870 [Dyadobacter frigoris]|uniref:Maltose/galactoside acetyltransferase domain-containing protein n=1 Tax=Dyadobacter frigoris TaxID=2576211 RepID=A0A4U6CVD7_9BACT|nr:hypothetical protein FDK13_29870 [Dyadobacter frigoris]